MESSATRSEFLLNRAYATSDLPDGIIAQTAMPFPKFGNASRSNVPMLAIGVLLAIEIPFATLIPTRRELKPPGPAATQIPSRSPKDILVCAYSDDTAGMSSAV